MNEVLDRSNPTDAQEAGAGKPDNEHVPHSFTILVNNQSFQTTAHTLTGAEIKSLAGVPADYELFQVRGHETVPVPNEETVHIHEKLEFRAIPAGTFGAVIHATTIS